MSERIKILYCSFLQTLTRYTFLKINFVNIDDIIQSICKIQKIKFKLEFDSTSFRNICIVIYKYLSYLFMLLSSSNIRMQNCMHLNYVGITRFSYLRLHIRYGKSLYRLDEYLCNPIIFWLSYSIKNLFILWGPPRKQDGKSDFSGIYGNVILSGQF